MEVCFPDVTLQQMQNCQYDRICLISRCNKCKIVYTIILMCIVILMCIFICKLISYWWAINCIVSISGRFMMFQCYLALVALQVYWFIGTGLICASLPDMSAISAPHYCCRIGGIFCIYDTTLYELSSVTMIQRSVSQLSSPVYLWYNSVWVICIGHWVNDQCNFLT